MVGMTTSGSHLMLPTMAIGPVMPNWGSWEWLGEELIPDLSRWFRIVQYRPGEIPCGDVVVVIKHSLNQVELSQVARTTPIMFCPIDCYGSIADIDADGTFLRRCARIIVHCRRLKKYFTPYSSTEEMDHHVRFIPEQPTKLNRTGPILWIGARSNLAPLVEWVNRHRLPRKLVILTNPENSFASMSAREFGFSSWNDIEIESWTPERHLARLAMAGAALDVKGTDFRQRHKPPTKAIDFIAGGVPLAMNQDASSVEHLSEMGFDVASPVDHDRWFSDEYAEETARFGLALREMLSRARIARRMRRIAEIVMAEGVPADIVASRAARFPRL